MPPLNAAIVSDHQEPSECFDRSKLHIESEQRIGCWQRWWYYNSAASCVTSAQVRVRWLQQGTAGLQLLHSALPNYELHFGIVS